MIKPIARFLQAPGAMAGMACVLSVAAVVSAQSPQSDAGDREPAAASQPVLSETALNALIDDLSSPAYRTRERAAAELMDAGERAVPVLKQAFDARAEFDTRRRIKQIALEIYLTLHVAPPRAFLGISHLGRSGRTSDDGRIPSWGTGLLITDVFTGSAADVGDIRRGDLILMLDGKASIGDYQATNFTEQIGRRRPGTPCTVGLLRGGEGLYLREGDAIGFEPAELAACKFEKVTSDDDPRVLPGTTALRLIDGSRLNPNSPLMRGDLIVALDDEMPDARAEDGGIAAWAGKRPPPSPTQMMEPAPVQPGVGVRKRSRASAQILRGGSWHTKSIRLGRWPSYLNDWLIRSRNLDAASAAAAMDGFESWWGINFDPKGLFSDRADGDRRWRMSGSTLSD